MDSSGKHQKEPASTDHKFRTDDEHIHEIDKQHLKESKKDESLIPNQGKTRPARKETET